jgi:hypothetical protein
MEMSAAAMRPIHGAIEPDDRQHKAFPAYEVYRTGCVRQLIAAESFRDWLAATERNKIEQRAREHPLYEDFRQWMVDEQAGARTCPAGSFPDNFAYWLEGGRW